MASCVWANDHMGPNIYGALAGQRSKKGVFITTSGYTAQALQFAQSVESVRLAELEGLDT